MNRILMIGCGDIALRTARLLRNRARLFGLLRTSARAALLRSAGITPLLGDLDQPETLARLAGIADVVLHFAPPPSTGEDDPRTQRLLAALSRGEHRPSCLIYISTSGVYGDCMGDWVHETRPPRPSSARAVRRLSAEQRIRSWAVRTGVRTCILRVPGIYAADRLPLDRLSSRSPAIFRDEDSYTNHIHADDLARIILATLRFGAPGRIYHANDDSDMKMSDYFDAVALAHDLPLPPRMSRAAVEQSVSPALWSFMNESRRLNNSRLKQELHFRLYHPTVIHTLQSLLR